MIILTEIFRGFLESLEVIFLSHFASFSTHHMQPSSDAVLHNLHMDR
jgi:hypothetical protein